MIDFLLMMCYSIIMRTEQYRIRDIVGLLRREKIATMPELKAALGGTAADVTVFRKLAELPYRTSYSHRGCYYTLDEIPDYDEIGLWCCRSVWFSRHGTLLSTVAALVKKSRAGFYACDLQNVVHVEVKGALLKLLRQRRLNREKVAGRYLYCSPESAERKEQVGARQIMETQSLPAGPLPHLEMIPDELKASIVLFISLLDEKQRRLYAGLESLKVGYGGDRQIAELLGLDTGTIARGRRELLSHDVEVERIRRAGAGRIAAEKKRPKSSPASKR